MRNPRGRARCRGYDVEVLDERGDGSSQIRFISGIMKGTTISVISDEVEYPETDDGAAPVVQVNPAVVADSRPAPSSPDVVCQCSDAEKEGTMTVPDDELGMYVCGVCGKPSRLALAKAAAQGGLVW